MQKENEIWKSIDGFEGLYEVSSFGRVRSLNRIIIKSNGRITHYKGRILKSNSGARIYPSVNLKINSHQKPSQVHTLVAKAFMEYPGGQYHVHHIDGNKNNANINNLEYKLASVHIINHGLLRRKQLKIPSNIKTFGGSSHPNAILNESSVKTIKQIAATGTKSMASLAKEFNVSTSTICAILHNKNWKYVTIIN